MAIMTNKILGKQLIDEVWNKGYLTLLDQVIKPHCIIHVPGLPASTGPEGFKQYILMFRNGFPDLLLTLQMEVAEDNILVEKLLITGTHQNIFMGKFPTQNKVEVTAVFIYRIELDKFEEIWFNIDYLSLFEQINII